MSDLFQGDNDFDLEIDELAEAFWDASWDFSYNTDDYDRQYAFAEGVLDVDVVNSLRPSTLKDDMPALYYSINIGCSYIMLAVSIILSLVILFFMAKKSVSQTLFAGGIAFIASGALWTILSLALPGIIGFALDLKEIAPIVSQIFRASLGIFITVLVIGVLAVAGSKFMVKRTEE